MSNLYQHATLGALMVGLMDGTATIDEILAQGDFGLGTLHALDGEVVFLDGKAYQGRADGKVIPLTGTEKTPYAAVTNFNTDKTFELTEVSSSEAQQKILENESNNLFLGIKITGFFKNMHIRVVPKQEKPYKRLVKVAEQQIEFTQNDIEGTIVGFFTPELFQGVAAAGFHLHFIDRACTFAGHIIDFELSKGMVEISRIESFIQHFPIDDPTFIHTELDYANLASEIQKAE